MDWGTIPAWVGAIGTTLAFAVAFRPLVLELKSRRDEARDEEMRQARLVWVDPGGMGTSSSGNVEARPVVHNDSPETIRDVFVKVYDDSGKHLGDTQPSAPALGPNREVTCFLKVVAPGRKAASAEVSFTDADGRRWKKSAKRMPERVLDN